MADAENKEKCHPEMHLVTFEDRKDTKKVRELDVNDTESLIDLLLPGRKR